HTLVDHTLFFFSSRRRHTRFSRDWSSDVCLPIFGQAVRRARTATYSNHRHSNTWGAFQAYGDERYRFPREDGARPAPAGGYIHRSEERRVGKEGASRRQACPKTKSYTQCSIGMPR